MQRRVHSLKGYTIHATDGELGKVDEFFFEDQSWTIRYLVVETGGWLSGRKVLISPVALGRPDWESRRFPVNLTMEQVQNSPDIDTEKPVSRQHEVELHGYYGWPSYWAGSPYAFGGCGYGAGYGMGAVFPVAFEKEPEKPAGSGQGDPHLRSTREITGYHIHALDGEIGHVEDFIVNDETWVISYFVVDTRNWLPGKRVLVSTQWITDVSWDNREVVVDLTREFVKNSPKFDPDQPVSLDYEKQLHNHYGRPEPGLVESKQL